MSRRSVASAVSALGASCGHVLPRGFTNVRHYGIYGPTRRTNLERARALIAATPLPSPDTATGTLLSVVVPLPSWPRTFQPQHQALPVAVSAHV